MIVVFSVTYFGRLLYHISLLVFIFSFVLFFVFFFKQKTAYEMRISDWSSDVCSSDLLSQIRQFASGFRALRAIPLNEFLGELGRKRPAVPLGISSLLFDRRGHIQEVHRRRLCLGG